MLIPYFILQTSQQVTDQVDTKNVLSLSQACHKLVLSWKTVQKTSEVYPTGEL